MDRTYEKAPLRPSQAVLMDEFRGTIRRIYIDGPYEGARMYEVQLQAGLICVCGADLRPVE